MQSKAALVQQADRCLLAVPGSALDLSMLLNSLPLDLRSVTLLTPLGVNEDLPVHAICLPCLNLNYINDHIDFTDTEFNIYHQKTALNSEF